MAAVLRIGSTDHDLYFAGGLDLGSHLRDVPELNPAAIFTDLPRPPLPDLPDPKLNRVVWPVTGLSHYAYGHVLVANDTAATSGTACTLNLTDGDADTARSLALTILNRRPLSDTRATLATSPDGAVEDPFDGWVLTLVDARYLRRKVVAAGDTIARTTWGELINSLGTAAGFTMPSASTIQALVHSDFGTPDATAWSPATLAGEGYSVAADAAALAVGLRLVVATDGTVTAQTPAASGTAYASWLTATGRDEFTAGGVVADRYAAPRNVQCNGVDVAMPSPTTRLDDRDYADLRSTASAFRTRWVQTYSDWLAATFVTADVRGFVLPPVCGVVQHVEYDLPACFTRIVKHPARYPLPLLKREEAAGGGGGGDPGPTVNLLVNQCPDGYGGYINEYVTVTLPAGATVSESWCVERPPCCAAPPPVTAESPCCPDVDLPTELWMTVAGRGSFRMTYLGAGDGRWALEPVTWPECSDANVNGDVVAWLQCVDTDGNNVPDTWKLVGNGFSIAATSVSCDPLELVFLDVPFQATGGPCASNLYDVTITP